MSKNIVICLDGTGNEIEADISNVLKLYRSLRKSQTQAVYYSQGVGTLVRVRVWAKFRQLLIDKLLGKIVGYGMDDRVVDAYRFIVENYERGDQIYIFGYSRGAYTARVLAGMIHAVGILKPYQTNLVGAAYAAYLSEPRQSPPTREAMKEASQFSPRKIEKQESKARTFRRITQTHSVPIRFLGLFDTVGSVLIPNFGRWSLIPVSVNPHPHIYRNPSVEIVRHAVSIDERRRMFPVGLWPEGQPYLSNPYTPKPASQTVDEVWFSGGHGDVGGGNPRKMSGLSQIPLIWMIEGATEAGMKVHSRMMKYVTGQKIWSKTTQYKYPEPDPEATLHRTNWLAWGILELIPSISKKVRKDRSQMTWPHFPFFRRRKIPENATLHASVLERMSRTDYKPGNIPDAYSVYRPEDELPKPPDP